MSKYLDSFSEVGSVGSCLLSPVELNDGRWYQKRGEAIRLFSRRVTSGFICDRSLLAALLRLSCRGGQLGVILVISVAWTRLSWELARTGQVLGMFLEVRPVGFADAVIVGMQGQLAEIGCLGCWSCRWLWRARWKEEQIWGDNKHVLDFKYLLDFVHMEM